MFCIKMSAINRRTKPFTKKESERGPTDSEFTHDFIRDVANRFTDPKTVSNMSKVSKKFNQALDLSNDKSKQRFLTETKKRISRHEFFPDSSSIAHENLTAVFKTFPNGKREGLYRELNDKNKIVREGNYVNGNLEGILTERRVPHITTEYNYESNVLKSLTFYQDDLKLFTEYVASKEDLKPRPRLMSSRKDLINDVKMYIFKRETFETNPQCPFHVIKEIEGEGIKNTIEHKNVKIIRKVREDLRSEELEETRYKNGELIFDMKMSINRSEGRFIVECEGKFIKIRSFKNSREVQEELFEDEKKIGELNYKLYQGYLSHGNELSEEKKSFYRGEEVNIVFPTDLPGFYESILQVAFCENNEGRVHKDSWKKVILGHNI